jgi:hypothetical protein
MTLTPWSPHSTTNPGCAPHTAFPQSRPRRVPAPRRQLAPALAMSVRHTTGPAPQEPAGGLPRPAPHDYTHTSDVRTGQSGLMLRVIR